MQHDTTACDEAVCCCSVFTLFISAALQATMKMFSVFARFLHVMKYGFYVNGRSSVQFLLPLGSQKVLSRRNCFTISVNYAAETFINLAKPYFSDVLEKVENLGTRSAIWKPRVLRKIPANQLPEMHGGTEDWKPLPFK